VELYVLPPIRLNGMLLSQKEKVQDNFTLFQLLPRSAFFGPMYLRYLEGYRVIHL